VTGTSFTSTPRTITWAANGGGFDIADPANTFSVAQTLSGTGPLSKLGAGTLVLLASNSYSGGTTITGGVLQLGNGGTSGSIVGNVVDNAVLAIDHSDTVTFPGVISGSGRFAQIGPGTTFLTAVNSYAGGTLVANGTLVGSATSFGGGPVLDNATLVFDQPTNASFANPISGSGQLIKQGAGALNLTGNSPLSGPTTVLAGLLSVNGTLAPSIVTVDNGATLGGNGTVGGIVANNGGTIAPGNFGALHAAAPGGGNAAFAPNSIFQVNLNAAGQNDKILATGTATITGGTVQVLPAPGLYTPSLIYTLLTANGGVFGIGGFQAPSNQRIQSTQFFSGLTIGSLGTNFAFLQPMLTYDAKDVYLEFPQVNPFPSVAITPNQVSTAVGVQNLGPGNPIFNAVVGQTVAGARQAFDALSGEIHASAVTAAFEDSRLPREAILDHLSQSDPSCVVGMAGCSCDDDRRKMLPDPIFTKAPELMSVKARHCEPNWFDVWAQAFGDWGRTDTDHNAATLDRSIDGLIIGADARVRDSRGDTWRFGAAGGYTNDRIDAAERLSSGNLQTDFGALYGSGSLGAIQLRAGAIYGVNTTTTNRQIVFPGFTQAAGSEYAGSTTQAFGEMGYRFGFSAFNWMGLNFSRSTLEPFLGAAAIHLHQNGFTETGGSAALTGLAQGYDLGTSTIGLRADATFVGPVPLTARALIGWRHAYGVAAPVTLMAFQSSPQPFAIAGVPIDRDAFLAEAGLDYAVTSAMTLGVSYSGQYGQRATDNAIKGRLNVSF
jgi:outer membrane autotransporter protein